MTEPGIVHELVGATRRFAGGGAELRSAARGGLPCDNGEDVMARVGFIGVGNMGSLMARNLIKAGHSLKVFDLNDEAVNFVVQSGAERAPSAKEAARSVDFVVSMLPVGANVRAVFLDDGVLAAADPGTVLIDSSTIDVETRPARFMQPPPSAATPCSMRRSRAASPAPKLRR